jgi:acyl-CoA thioester hydrolase
MDEENMIHEHKDRVRDYECDIQGIVNNANYQHYLEHARHMFLKSRQLSFAELHDQGIDCVVSRIDLRFKYPLRGMDEFVVRTSLVKEGIRYVFFQDIYRAADDKLCLKGRVEVVCLINGRLGESPYLEEKLL